MSAESGTASPNAKKMGRARLPFQVIGTDSTKKRKLSVQNDVTEPIIVSDDEEKTSTHEESPADDTLSSVNDPLSEDMVSKSACPQSEQTRVSDALNDSSQSDKLAECVRSPMRNVIQNEEEFTTPESENSEENACPDATSNQVALPPESAEEKVTPPLKVDDFVYAARHSIYSAWVPATIVKIRPKGTLLSNGTEAPFSMMHVKFEPMTPGKNFFVKEVSGRQVATMQPSTYRYSIGTRVIALFKDQTQQKKKDAYYSGVIAEMPAVANMFRYLVFCDDGHAQYVKHTDAIRVYEMSQHVFEDVCADSRDFIKNYLSTFRDRVMVEVQADDVIKVEWKGEWWSSRVLAVDSSLALLQFSEELDERVVREEWLYRGSNRFQQLFFGATSDTNKKK